LEQNLAPSTTASAVLEPSPRRRHARAVLAVPAILLLLGGCGGRAIRPAAITTSHDEQLSCDHLRAERTVNDKRILDLGNERGDGITNNIGFFIVSPLFMDVSGTESKEIAALQERNKTLERLAAGKCPNGTIGSG
jgi:hypothetical protein